LKEFNIMSKKTHFICYSIESFQYLNEGTQRKRPWLAVALLGHARAAAPQEISDQQANGVTKKSLAIYSQENATLDDGDLFLPGHDGGHLIADALGGTDDPRNRVPMALDQNRGGNWASLERAAGNSAYAVYVVRCDYNNSIDPRIPVRVRAWLYEISQAHFQALSSSGAMTTLSNQGDALINLAVNSNAGQATVLKVTAADFSQDPFHFVKPKTQFSISSAKLEDLFIDNPLPDGWAIEDQTEFALRRYNDGQVIGNTGMTVNWEWNLPPLTERPNAWLDYLALKGKLDDVVQAGNKYVKFKKYINSKYSADSVPAEYRYLLMVWNLKRYSHVRQEQEIYCSEAADDASALGYRFTMAPEIDHIIPRSLQGPTIFSNLRLTSRTYNNARKNSVNQNLLNGAIKIGPTVVKRDKRKAGEPALGDKLDKRRR
jgi:hypothetical protein